MRNIRLVLEGSFLALTLGIVFLWQGNAEAWCPFGAVEAIYTYVHEGNMICSLGVSNFYIFGAVILSVLFLRRAFCGYVCPLGTLSRWLGSILPWLGWKNLRVPPAWDRLLAFLKYPILVVIVAATWWGGELCFRGYDPCYALISRHGADITFWAYGISAVLVLASLVVVMPFCRWLCPLAAVLNPVSRWGLTRVKRDAETCLGCKECARACPMAIPVDTVSEVTAARCISCLKCLDVCPAQDAGALRWGPPDRLGRSWPKVTLVFLLLLCLGGATTLVYLAPLPSFIRSHGTPTGPVAEVRLRIKDLTCRGRANLLVGFLERDDMYAIPNPGGPIPGYYKLEAWPSPGTAEVRISFDSRCTNEEILQRAITEPYFDAKNNHWWISPFVIEGYNPLDLPEDDAVSRPQ